MERTPIELPEHEAKAIASQIDNEVTEVSYEIVVNKMRANIELTAIADNKANVLLSLNAVILTLFIPPLVEHLDYVLEHHLYLPISLLVLSCLTTIVLAVSVLRPGKIKNQSVITAEQGKDSPFFYGNTELMTKEQYLSYFEIVIKNQNKVRSFLINDYYHIALRLSEKMRHMRKAFNVFMIGLGLSVVIAFGLICFY